MPNLYLPYAGESLDMLNDVLAALDGCPVPVVVIDNSHERKLSGLDYFATLTPPAPLTLWQTLWMLCHQGEPFLWTQCDASFSLTDVNSVLGAVASPPHPWGVVFTHYDSLSALNAPELLGRNVLPDLNLPHYHGDPDWYRRMSSAGLNPIQIVGHSVTHTGNTHWKTSHARKVARLCMDSARYYREKWGGDIGSERFSEPWNGSR